MNISLRTASPNDETFLYKLYADSRADELTSWGWNATQQELFLKLQFTAQQQYYKTHYPNADFQIVCQGELSIGQIIIDKRQNEIRFVDIALLREYQNKGIGTKIFTDLLEEATQTQQIVTLHVVIGNRAKQLYERLGFVTVSHDEIYYFMQK